MTRKNKARKGTLRESKGKKRVVLKRVTIITERGNITEKNIYITLVNIRNNGEREN